jgi:hypothetical protein
MTIAKTITTPILNINCRSFTYSSVYRSCLSVSDVRVLISINLECEAATSHSNISIKTNLMIALPTPQNCCECPMARPLNEDRFSCGNSLSKVVRGHFPATAECHDALSDLPHRYFQPLPLPDLQGLDPEWVCDRIRLTLNWLDVFEDAPGAKDGEIAIEVCHQDLRIAYLRRDANAYYCTRLDGLRSSDPYWLALHLVHPDYLYQIPDEILADRSLVPDYF